MRLAVVSLLLSAAAFCQNPPPVNPPPVNLFDKLDPVAPDLLTNRLKSMSLFNAPVTPLARPMIVAEPKPAVCAIPLLNALPAAKDSAEFKIRIVKPNVQEALMARSAPAQIGIPACK